MFEINFEPRTSGEPKQPDKWGPVPCNNNIPRPSGEPKQPSHVKGTADTDRKSGKPKQSKIDEFFATTDKQFGIDDSYTRLDKREKFQREQYSKKTNITLNEKISHGLRAGDIWAEKMAEREKVVRMQHTGDENDTPLQDFEKPIVCMGADVVSLYPNIDGISVARVAADAVRRTKIEFSGINYMFLSVYLL